MRWFTRPAPSSRLSRKADVLPSPNIWYYPKAYEIENRAQDVDGEIWQVLAESAGWRGKDVLDVGCGDGFHLPRFAEQAKSVLGVEPHQPLVERALLRVEDLASVTVLRGCAQALPVADASVDVVHARTAYFFGPGCEPGLLEAERVLRPGGVFAIVDLDVSRGPYGDWMRADLPDYDPVAVERFFEGAGFGCRRVETRWRFDDAEDMKAVLKIEFSAAVAERAIAEVLRANDSRGPVTLPVSYRVHVRRKPTGLVIPLHSASDSSSSDAPRIP
ncbi:class I SAM-dependent methyltransferase [Amycolatopsis sp. NPDC059657]|uniref:class I SAM-dependent methyltransferase n=1 Tax=Amycolatopsis sp. NPDC059657 TaxID=3346899 RepID=UPI0036709940